MLSRDIWLEIVEISQIILGQIYYQIFLYIYFYTSYDFAKLTNFNSNGNQEWLRVDTGRIVLERPS